MITEQQGKENGGLNLKARSTRSRPSVSSICYARREALERNLVVDCRMKGRLVVLGRYAWLLTQLRTQRGGSKYGDSGECDQESQEEGAVVALGESGARFGGCCETRSPRRDSAAAAAAAAKRAAGSEAELRRHIATNLQG